MSVALPRFAKPLDRQTHNRYLQTYRRWARHQNQHGKPVTCWCLYLWISGNQRRGISSSRLPVRKPEECKRSVWQGWLHHRRENGRLSFPEYMARYEKRSKAGQGRRSDIISLPVVKEDSSLRMEPSAVVAKINRILAAQGIGKR